MHVASLVPEQWSRTFFWLVFSWSQFFFHNGDVDSYSSTCIRVKSNEQNISLDLYINIISCNIMKGQEMHIIFLYIFQNIYIYTHIIFLISYIFIAPGPRALGISNNTFARTSWMPQGSKGMTLRSCATICELPGLVASQIKQSRKETRVIFYQKDNLKFKSPTIRHLKQSQ